MIDSRLMDWRHLFPADIVLTTTSGWEPFSDAVEALSVDRGERVLVTWNEPATDLPSLHAFAGLVAINCRGLDATSLREAGFHHIYRFAVLPDLQDVRWFIPTTSPRIASASLGLTAAGNPTTGVRTLGARIGARAGLTRWYRDEVVIARRTLSPIEEMLHPTLERPAAAFALSTGTPGPARKPTMAALDADGGLLAFVKISRSDTTLQMVENEGRMLEHLAGIPGLAGRVPEVLAAGTIDGRAVLIQRALAGDRPMTQFSDSHQQLLDTLRTGPQKIAGSTALMQSLTNRRARLRVFGPDVTRVLEWSREVLRRTVIHGTIGHGDFTPWNLRLDHGRMGAFDWEYGRLDALPLLDELHYRIQSGIALSGWTSTEAFGVIEALVRPSANPDHRPEARQAFTTVYLLDWLLRARQQGHTQSEPAFLLRMELLQQCIRRFEGVTS